MSELAEFGTHARRMSTAEHKDECEGEPVCVYAALQPRASCAYRCADGCTNQTRHSPAPDCSGCVTDADRALWARLADECDAYLHHDEEAGLFT